LLLAHCSTEAEN